MARNIEIKAHIDDVGAMTKKAAALADQGPFQIVQDDTFFRCRTGRLKLRAFSGGTGELIHYRRENQRGPKESSYLIAPTSSPDSLREVLTLAFGTVGRVRKHRVLFLAGRTRIHLDDVEQLGHFLELEVVLADDEPADAGVRQAQQFLVKLEIEPEQLIEDAYIDLLTRQSLPTTGAKSSIR
jgi:predicted adenylyl cyclase CyaB